MSTDYYLYSKRAKRCVMIGSEGLGGVKSWPVEYGGREFIKWVIENNISDVVMVNEHQLPDEM
jgi:hypothetical protein